MVLLIDTSGQRTTVALVHDSKLVAVREWESNSRLGAALLTEIDALLQSHHISFHEIERVAVHRGRMNSSFMALRAGIVTGSLLAQALGKGLVSVSGESREDIAQEARQAAVVAVIEPFYGALRQAQGKNHSKE